MQDQLACRILQELYQVLCSGHRACFQSVPSHSGVPVFDAGVACTKTVFFIYHIQGQMLALKFEILSTSFSSFCGINQIFIAHIDTLCIQKRPFAYREASPIVLKKLSAGYDSAWPIQQTTCIVCKKVHSEGCTVCIIPEIVTHVFCEC